MIARPFALLGFSAVFALYLLCLTDLNVAFVAAVAALCLVFSLASKALRRDLTVAVCCFGLLIGSLGFALNAYWVDKMLLPFAGENREIEAVIVSNPSFNGSKYTYTLRAESVDGADADFKLLFRTKLPLDAQPYDRVEFIGSIYEAGNTSDEVKAHYKSKGLYLGATAEDEMSISFASAQSRPPMYYVLKLNSYISARLNELIPNEAGGVAECMLTGSKAHLSSQTISSFSYCGLSHILAVSGLHMSIIVLYLYSALSRIFKRRYRAVSAVCIAVAVIYAGVTGFTASAVRSCIMVCIMLLGNAIDRNSDSLNSLGAAALIITLINPNAVMDTAFMLSFSATLGIVLFAKVGIAPIKTLIEKVKIRRLARLMNALAEAVATSLVATLFCLPVYIYKFSLLSLVFVPANLLTFWAVPLVLICGIFSALPLGIVAEFSAVLCRICSGYILAVVNRLPLLDWPAVTVNTYYFKFWLAAVLGFIGIIILAVKNSKTAIRLCSAFVCVSLALTAVLSYCNDRDKINVTAVESGNDYCFIVSKGARAVIIGCGAENSYSVTEALDELGVGYVELMLLEKVGCSSDVAACVPTERIVKRENFDYSFNGCNIEYRYAPSGSYCRLVSENGTVLFLFGRNTQENFVGSSAQADFLFCRCQPPSWYDFGGCSAAVISAAGGTKIDYSNAYSTADNGNITLTFGKNKSFTVR